MGNRREIENGEGNHVYLDALDVCKLRTGNFDGGHELATRLRMFESAKWGFFGRLLLHAVGGCVSVAGLIEIAGEARAEQIASSPKAKKLPAELLRVNAQDPEPEVLRYAADFS